jgi:Flp pilus assembly protein TadG
VQRLTKDLPAPHGPQARHGLLRGGRSSTSRALTRRTRRRLAGERGASAVLVALLLVPLLGAAALAVDLGSLYAQRAALQTAADAAALAIAQDCARGSCGATDATATSMITANASAASLAGVTLDATTVTVQDRTVQPSWFARVLGVDSSTVGASATATWGNPGSLVAALPLAFSWCEFAAQTGGGLPSGTVSRTIYLTKTSGATGCTKPGGNVLPGGFGWTDTDPGACRASSHVGSQVGSDPGNSPPGPCSPAYLAGLVGTTVLLPIFDQAGSQGSNGWYRVFGYAAFRVTGYNFAGQFQSTPQPCGGNARCLSGYFTRFVDTTASFPPDPNAPLTGLRVVRLVR